MFQSEFAKTGVRAGPLDCAIALFKNSGPDKNFLDLGFDEDCFESARGVLASRSSELLSLSRLELIMLTKHSKSELVGLGESNIVDGTSLLLVPLFELDIIIIESENLKIRIELRKT